LIQANEGFLNGQSFLRVENLTGNRFSDTFDFTASGRVTGTVNGRGDVDTLSYQSRTTGVQVDLTAGTADAVGESVNQIENVLGSQGDDDLVGNGDDNRLVGNSGRDTLDGRDGNDTLDGGADNDTLNDFSGTDTLIGGN